MGALRAVARPCSYMLQQLTQTVNPYALIASPFISYTYTICVCVYIYIELSLSLSLSLSTRGLVPRAPKGFRVLPSPKNRLTLGQLPGGGEAVGLFGQSQRSGLCGCRS